MAILGSGDDGDEFFSKIDFSGMSKHFQSFQNHGFRHNPMEILILTIAIGAQILVIPILFLLSVFGFEYMVLLIGLLLPDVFNNSTELFLGYLTLFTISGLIAEGFVIGTHRYMFKDDKLDSQ